MPDARKPLTQLYAEWKGCTKCPLGEKRQERGGKQAFGTGEGRRSVVFVGEGPGENEEIEGAPFVGRSGEMLRTLIRLLGIRDYHFTNAVLCRSAVPVLDENNMPRMRGGRFGKPKVVMMKDEPPPKTCIETCRERLLEEIYLLNPFFIVALGGQAAEALLGRAVGITQERGKPVHISIPGAATRPVLTEKRRVWIRRGADGELTAPVTPNEVFFLVMPTFHPAYVLRQIQDRRPISPFNMLKQDLRDVARAYEQYCFRVYGTPMGQVDYDEAMRAEESEEEDGEEG